MLTTTSSSGTGGPGISLSSLFLPGAQYTITGFVELTAGESASDANFTIERTDPACSGGTCFDTIGSLEVPVNATGWAEIGGAYTASSTETSLFLYARLVGVTAAQSFYLDDVIINETAAPPAATPEPRTVGAMVIGIGCMLMMRKRVANGLLRATRTIR